MIVVDPQVTLIAHTHFDADAAAAAMEGFRTDADGGQALAEAAGRACYQSFAKPNPATATNAGYLRHILEVGHESVLEHASASFYVTGVSRSLLAELSRHRHISLSVRSQRYCDEGDPGIVLPPAANDTTASSWLMGIMVVVEAKYHELVEHFTDVGLPRKQAREAARAVLPNMVETRFVLTANMCAYRDVLRRRWHVAADAEIQRFAGMLLEQLRVLAPNVFQDFPAAPFGSDA